MSKKLTQDYNATSEKIFSLLSRMSEHFYAPLRFGTGEERKPVTKADLEKLERAYAQLNEIATACGVNAHDLQR